MLKLKVKNVGMTEDSQFIKIQQYKTKHTNTGEHICAIGVLVNAIMENDEDMSISKLCNLIKDNYKQSLKEREER